MGIGLEVADNCFHQIIQGLMILYDLATRKSVIINDHRLAMALAVVGLRVPGIGIQNESCLNKSFPNFWELWDNL